MKFVRLLVDLVLCSLLIITIKAESQCTEGPAISLYNIATSFLACALGEKDIKSDYSHHLLGEDAKASWRLIDNQDGSVSFRSVHFPLLCMRHEKRTLTSDDPIWLDTCNIENDSRFKFDIRLHKSGAVQLQLKNTNKCIFDKGKGTWYYGLYSNDCDEDRKFLWAFIPPLKIDI